MGGCLGSVKKVYGYFMNIGYPEGVDPLILPAVKLLNEHGFQTFESCQGGEGHCYDVPTVRFFGTEHELIRAFEICQAYSLNVFNAKRVFRKEDIYTNQGVGEGNEMPKGTAWCIPFNEIEFVMHSKTGTIFSPV